VSVTDERWLPGIAAISFEVTQTDWTEAYEQ
jgi:hypothetical protein